MRDRGHDVLARHDPGVQVYLEAITDRTAYVGKDVERHRSTIQLPTTVVRQHDRVHPDLGQRLGVGDGLHALDRDLPRPLITDPRQILIRHRRVEHRVQQLRHRPRPRIQRRKRQRLGGQEVDPPRRPRDRARHRARSNRGRDRHAIAYVAQPRPRHRHVDRHHQRVETRLRSPIHQRHRAVAVLPHIQLEPVPTVRVRRRDLQRASGARAKDTYAATAPPEQFTCAASAP